MIGYRNWRDLEVGLELDCVIAERLGWRIEQKPWMGQDSYHVIYPSGNPVYITGSGGRVTGLIQGYEQLRAIIPCFSRNAAIASDALTLPDGFSIVKFDNGWRASPETPNSTAFHKPGLADAICRAWLAYDDALSAQQESESYHGI